MWTRDFNLLLLGISVALGCGGSSTKVENEPDPSDAGDAGEGSGGGTATGGASKGGSSKGGAPGKGGSTGKGGRGGVGGSMATGGKGGNPEGGAAGEAVGGAGGAPTCGDEECAAGLSCHPELGCAKICPTGELVLPSRAAVIAFAAQGCQVLDGSLTIRAPTLTHLDDLGQPSPLRIITGTLTIDQNPVLENLEGFAGLETIGGSLIITGNYLDNLGGLESLRFLGTHDGNALIIAQNFRLNNVVALGGLTRLMTSLVVGQNDALVSLAGIDRLRATSSVTITNNAVLTEVAGLTDLEESQSVVFAGNPTLATISLPGFASVGSLTITGNDALDSVSLPALATAENLTIAGNQNLTTLGTLNALMDVGMLVIAGNARLPQCFVDQLDMRLMACNMSCGGNDMTAVCN